MGEWLAYFRLDPWGESRADLRAAIVASTVANAMARKKGGGHFKPEDFMPYLERDRQQGDADLSRRLRAALSPYSKKRKR